MTDYFVIRARVSRDQMETVEKFAKEQGVSISDVVRRSCAEYIDGFTGSIRKSRKNMQDTAEDSNIEDPQEIIRAMRESVR